MRWNAQPLVAHPTMFWSHHFMNLYIVYIYISIHMLLMVPNSLNSVKKMGPSKGILSLFLGLFEGEFGNTGLTSKHSTPCQAKVTKLFCQAHMFHWAQAKEARGITSKITWNLFLRSMFSAQDTLPELWFRLQSNMMATCNNWSQPAARTAFSFDEFKLTSCATLGQVTVARNLVRGTNKGYYFA